MSELSRVQALTAVIIGDLRSESYELMRAVEQAASAEGLTVRYPSSVVEPGMSFAASIDSDLRSSDVVLAIVGEATSPTTWFEIGMATAYGKPLVLVRSSTDVTLPIDPSSVISVGPIVTQRGLALAIQRATFKPQRRKLPAPEQLRTGRPLGKEADVWLRRLSVENDEELPEDRARGVQSYLHFENWFDGLLSYAEVPYERSVRDATRGRIAEIDFVVNAEELAANLGSLLPVELLASRRPQTLLPALKSRVPSFRRHLQSTGASAILVVARELWDAPQILDSWESKILLCSAAELVEAMREETFGNAVIYLRNTAVQVGDAW